MGPEKDGAWKRGREAETNRTRKHEEGGKKKKRFALTAEGLGCI